ncbi:MULTISPECIES: MarR family winged helix-turn-helix transcriptional regulator [unclassified Brevundimonas]|uniref:MarR family winged helix-turn-helix transcriptional regulator n=1 Tax=unclassified Brevundimonas TaxID=2622653 RepID=UPI000CFA9E89|nr:MULTISPECIES: MarR family transcriptional regulator [unclassified Brevundimonas]PRA35761.1 MarR family transcriptional regulator [Brevundimonas sp. MYb27]PQZ83142.1 MarR family transcriptional regulator [Brevundimonas sp. MYb31]PRB16298.1 MarR family transcriptional regulator [Brevundimonas sp. MYb52]PRB34897.1 MarR family transcriptional regulator [Brevundimonas sp. MYb46]PRB55595.1 MarR family transcriptional regulator [Brevundimonas sp. MYb33]
MIELNRTYLGRVSEQLSELIEQQSAEVFKRAGLIIPVKSSSLMAAIATLGPVSVADLGRALDRSHQLIQQKVPKLVALGLVTRQPDPADQRVNLIAITDRGREQLALLDSLDGEFERAYAEMEQDAGPVFDTIKRAILSLQARTLVERIDV